MQPLSMMQHMHVLFRALANIVIIIVQRSAESSPNFNSCSKYDMIGTSFNPSIISEDLSHNVDDELTTAGSNLTHEGDILYKLY